ncbi:four-carbon acid sugar kinase family protein [Natribacillus halophilus]|uniref:Uncharacterized conserved protein YgbK, DUF1537 family n=1 Tax=Natribacillus halophilus TaxID=549003 RepID=A0A1G8SLN3_9BACI|nr:four-carbon acid sugar kinase family protein [Natribacillus halophilus]SDJ30111.1 Uncharacterized conserved protein YgbK, DUF1537 family [Natribacillus halophilus]
MTERLLFAFYGDDFTGSTDAMEALTIHGLRTVLFLEVPTEELLDEFENVQCIGIAGTARAKSRYGMREELLPIYEKLDEINPQYIHYKTCSTFDSSPETGSIGYAADLAREYFKHQQYPVLAAVPQLGRYTVFGQHFAKMNEQIYRLDRHPVVSKHPITPMIEADLKVHLMEQTNQSVGNINVLEIEGGVTEKTAESVDEEIIIYDALKEEHLDEFANQVTNTNRNESQFLIGSSGVEYALGKLWGDPSYVEDTTQNSTEDNRILVVSGSVSEITSDQMAQAVSDGFHIEQIPYYYFGYDELPQDFLIKVTELIEEKKKVILYTADGPNDPAIEKMKEHVNDTNDIGYTIGHDLGVWTKKIIENCHLDRVIISGGDTSGFVTKELEIYALELLSSISPGAPLCVAYSKNEIFNEMQIALKGGQLGGKDFYKRVMTCK